jgi:hypothetical protein
VVLHRNTGKVLRTAFLMAAFGCLGLALPTLLDLMGREFVLGPWLAYGFGGLIALLGFAQIYMTLRHPFRFEADDAALIVRCENLKADIPWESLAAVTIERPHYADETSAPHLILWPAPGADLGTKAKYKRKGEEHAGYDVIPIDDLVESPSEVVAALQRVAGARFAARDLPTG